jgi:hypothetical protein
MGASLYEPINVYKQVAANIGIVDGPLEFFTVGGMPIPFTTRMTVVRLANGDLFLHSPIAFDEPLAAELQMLGIVRHLISPNQWHYAHIGEWQRAFPEAVTWASPGVRRRARARHIDVWFDRDLESFPPEEWRSEIDQTLVPGGIFREFVFFPLASGTLILTDTIMNLELEKLTEPWRTIANLSGICYPRSQSFLGCGRRSCCSSARPRPRFRKSVRGMGAASCSAMGDASMRTQARLFGGCSAETRSVRSPPVGQTGLTVCRTHGVKERPKRPVEFAFAP